MKRVIFPLVAAAAALSIAALPALAAEGEKLPQKAAKESDAKPAGSGSQQNRMKTCNAEAARKSLKGEERKAFMSSCLKG